MFVSKATLAKIAIGSMITSAMTFATLMPAGASELHPNVGGNAGMSMQRTVQEGLLPLPLSNIGLPDKAAAQIISLGDGIKEILVMPRAYLGKIIPLAQNGVDQVAVSATQGQAVDGQATTSTGDDQAANSGTTVTTTDQGQTANSGTTATKSSDQGQTSSSGATATTPSTQGQATSSGTTATTPSTQGQAANSGATVTTPSDQGQAAKSGATVTIPADQGQALNSETTVTTPSAISVNIIYAKLLNSYDKLLNIYDHLLNFFGTTFTH